VRACHTGHRDDGAGRALLRGALARRALGRIARDRGALVEAEGHLWGAYQVFESIGAAYEGARTSLDLAALADTSGRLDTSATHLAAARKTFSDLRIAFYATRPVMRTASLTEAAPRGPSRRAKPTQRPPRPRALVPRPSRPAPHTADPLEPQARLPGRQSECSAQLFTF
jgi:hypothetical protein